MANCSEIRYYVGDPSDLDDMSYFEVEASTFTFDWEAEEAATEFYDETYPPVEVGGLEFDASRIVSELDPVAWRVYLSEEVTEVHMCDYDDTGSED